MEKQPPSSQIEFSKSKILEVVRTYFLNLGVPDCSKIDENSRFDDDLGLDEQAINEMTDFFEEEFTSMSLGFRIDMIDRKDIETVGDLVEIIRNRVAGEKKAQEDD